MLVLIAWRNVWRNRIRSLVLVSSIALGIWAGIFILAFSWGMSSQYVNIAIKGQISHLQIHQKEFKKDKKIRFTIKHYQSILDQISALLPVKASTGRTQLNGMVSSPTNGLGTNVVGIDPEEENKVTELRSHLKEGEYFAGKKHHQILIGEKLAKKLKVKLNNKIILTFQDIEGNITAGAFRVTGIFATHNSAFDEGNVFVKATELNSVVGMDPNDRHEIAVLLNEHAKLDSVHHQLQKLFPQLMVETWKEIAPELSFVSDSFNQSMYLFISIILLALMFGIINTMLMAVLERVQEIGVLMAIGMNKLRLFLMIMMETLFIAFLGGPLGVILAYACVAHFGKTGIDLSAFSEGLSSYGMDTVIYPSLLLEQYVVILTMVFGASMLAAIYPALKALKLKPVNAIRKI